MTILNLPDHLLIVLISVAYPVYTTLIWYRHTRPQLEAGKPDALVRLYRNTVIELWLLTAVVLSWWFWAGRAIAVIGLGIPGGWGFWIGVIVFVVVTVALGRQIAVVRSSADARAQVRKQLSGSTALIVPHNTQERLIAVSAGLTAGFCEEVLYRAFFLWYLMTWLPDFAAVAISSILFGVAHLYQGRDGVIKATVAGVIFSAVYLFTGSLWVPIFLHATVDIMSLLTSSIALEHGDSVAVSSAKTTEASN